MQKKKEVLDIINIILEDCIMAYPVSSFIISLYKQYNERGSLSKKQLQGLYGKASEIENMPPGKLAALESIIKKMPTRFKSPKPEARPLFEKDEATGKIIQDILDKFPEHKRVLFIKSKYDNNEVLPAADLNDLKRFHKIVLNKK